MLETKAIAGLNQPQDVFFTTRSNLSRPSTYLRYR